MDGIHNSDITIFLDHRSIELIYPQQADLAARRVLKLVDFATTTQQMKGEYNKRAITVRRK